MREHYREMATDYPVFRDFLRREFGR
jgi:hypothetical protein